MLPPSLDELELLVTVGAAFGDELDDVAAALGEVDAVEAVAVLDVLLDAAAA